ncbi:MAG: hypothetical protein H0X24_15200 [Ktedonobacterales bacterium]|nr:hypothetical protein [Ktedonobacterales bacterium]
MRSSPRSSRSDPSHPLPFIGGALSVLVVVALVALFNGHAAPSGAQAAGAKAAGWQTAQGISGAILQVAFAPSPPTRGYASVFLDKSSIAVYRTTDEGVHWGQVATLTTPLLDVLALNPANPQDLALLPSALPAAGTYTLQRSRDGGKTWVAASVTLADAASVAAIGWAKDALLVAFSRDDATDGGSHLVAFAAQGGATVLDNAGRLGTIRIDQIRYLHGDGTTITVVGVTQGSTADATAVAGARTSTNGATWVPYAFTQGNESLLPLGATRDGQTVLSIGSRRHTVYLSRNAGQSWHAEHVRNASAFDLTAARPLIAADGAYFLKLTSDLEPGQYSLQSGIRGRYTGTKDLSALSYDGAGHLHRLWATDGDALMWQDA